MTPNEIGEPVEPDPELEAGAADGLEAGAADGLEAGAADGLEADADDGLEADFVELLLHEDNVSTPTPTTATRLKERLQTVLPLDTEFSLDSDVTTHVLELPNERSPTQSRCQPQQVRSVAIKNSFVVIVCEPKPKQLRNRARQLTRRPIRAETESQIR
jgi:hypothetical protein